VVGIDWLFDSWNKGKKADEDQYLLGQPAPKPKDIESKKRARSETPPENEDSTAEEEKPLAKKLKDEPKTNSKPLNIPVDEYCPLARQLFEDMAYSYGRLIEGRQS
jgi:hypothetical protein